VQFTLVSKSGVNIGDAIAIEPYSTFLDFPSTFPTTFAQTTHIQDVS
jgi:hypothetical protein